MGVDDIKGRAKEAAGDLTNDPELEREGKIDQASDKVKGAVNTAKEKLSGLLGKKD